MKSHRWALFLALFGTMGARGSLMAGSQDNTTSSSPDPERSPIDDLIPPPPPVRLELRLSFGRLNHEGDGMKQIYGENTNRFGAMGGLFFGEGHDSLLYFGISRTTGEGIAYGKYSRTRSDDTTSLISWPVEAGLAFRYPNLISKNVVPTLRFGLDLQPIKETISSDDSGSSVRVYETTYAGAHMMAGCFLRLDDEGPTWSVDAQQGTKGTAVSLEVGYRWVNNFGRSHVDLSGIFLQGGVILEF